MKEWRVTYRADYNRVDTTSVMSDSFDIQPANGALVFLDVDYRCLRAFARGVWLSVDRIGEAKS